MTNITFAIASLLASGFIGAKLCQLLRLPSVTGYICAGMLIGPSGFNFISAETIGHELNHFTQIALMMVAFGIGEHLEIHRLRSSAKNVSIIGIAEIFCTFIFVSLGCFVIALMTSIGGPSWVSSDYIVLATLLGAVSIATAPAATLIVIREIRAAGPLTTTLLAVVAIDNGLAIMMFGISMAVAHQIMASESASIYATIGPSLFEIAGSLVLGVTTGFLIDFINNLLRKNNEMLTIGLALLLLCGEGARMLNLSPLLAGMAAGFTIVNRDHRDMRIFRILNTFEPPIYVLFFTLAGIHLEFSTLLATGWIGLAYFFLRSIGKITGSYFGAGITTAPITVQRYLGYTLMPQAGVAIGLIFLINSDPALHEFSAIITPVVLAGVMLSELIGPISAKAAIKMAGEAAAAPDTQSFTPLVQGNEDEFDSQGVPLVPWTWPRLQPPDIQDGVVIFSANEMATGAALARVSTIIAHYFKASPIAVLNHLPGNSKNPSSHIQLHPLLLSCQSEVTNLGYELYCNNIIQANASDAILNVATHGKTLAIVLGHSASKSSADYQKTLAEVVENANCPVVSIQFKGILHTENILVPIVNMRELPIVLDVLRALAGVGQHKITILRLLPSYEPDSILQRVENRLVKWMEMENLSNVVQCRAISTDSRLESIISASNDHDLVVMPASRSKTIQRLFFGSLTQNVANRCEKTLITVFSPTA